MNTDNTPTATLYVVATPIGNLDDISLRACKILKSVAAICAEDTRHSGQLLAHLGIKAPLIALHEHNEIALSVSLVRLYAGKDLALICDAGTPLISDPGFRLVRAARKAGFKVSPIPGACAAIAALSVAGLPSDRFLFEGFLPAKPAARRAYLQTCVSQTATLVFYESPHRIIESLADMITVFGEERPAVLARELSKQFETVLDGSLRDLSNIVQSDANQRKGEFVLLVQGATDNAAAELAQGQRIYATLSAHLPPSLAAKLAAELSGAPRKALYQVK